MPRIGDSSDFSRSPLLGIDGLDSLRRGSLTWREGGRGSRWVSAFRRGSKMGFGVRMCRAAGVGLAWREFCNFWGAALGSQLPMIRNFFFLGPS